MILFPNAKINIGLRITRKREDGYHDLETIFFPVALTDVLEFVPAPAFHFQSSGLYVEGDPAQNLCVKAYRLLKDRFPELKEVSMHLHKIIPTGAGLGGGSADGSFLLKALNQYFELGLNRDELLQLALQLGSDCPFFIGNEPAYATGRGEIMEPVSVNLQGSYIVLVHPGIHVSTASAFSHIRPVPPAVSLKELIGRPIGEWRNTIINDFEGTVFDHHPSIRHIKESLYRQGAIYASMTGSGSCCYGIFDAKADPQFPTSYQVFRVQVK